MCNETIAGRIEVFFSLDFTQILIASKYNSNNVKRRQINVAITTLLFQYSCANRRPRHVSYHIRYSSRQEKTNKQTNKHTNIETDAAKNIHNRTEVIPASTDPDQVSITRSMRNSNISSSLRGRRLRTTAASESRPACITDAVSPSVDTAMLEPRCLWKRSSCTAGTDVVGLATVTPISLTDRCLATPAELSLWPYQTTRNTDGHSTNYTVSLLFINKF